jgi:hypothetical protein
VAASVLDRLRAALADRYEIVREVGSGGMATVYLATDIRHQRRVACCATSSTRSRPRTRWGSCTGT